MAERNAPNAGSGPTLCACLEALDGHFNLSVLGPSVLPILKVPIF